MFFIFQNVFIFCFWKIKTPIKKTLTNAPYFLNLAQITSFKVMRDLSGIRKGAGFVVFSTPEEASRDLAEMNSKMIVSKPLYVVLLSRKK